MRWTHRHLSPSLIVASLALFLSLGGSGYAIAKKISPQPRCAAGAVRGIALVTGDINGIQNLPADFSGKSDLFGYRFNCSGGRVEVRRGPSVPAFEVRFLGVKAGMAVATAIGSTPAGVSVLPMPDGSFRVFFAAQRDPQAGTYGAVTNLQFLIVVF